MKRQTIRTRYYITHLGHNFIEKKRFGLKDSYRDPLVILEEKLPKGLSLPELYLSGVEKSVLDTLVESYLVTTNSKARYKPL
jgi:hypothetical protein